MYINEEEILRIVHYHNNKYIIRNKKSEDEINQLVFDAVAMLREKTYNFETYDTITLNQEGRRREVCKYKEWTSELFICSFLKRTLDSSFKIIYPNRNNFIHLLFRALDTINKMNDFVIIKFDFKDYFNSINSKYIYNYYVHNSNIDRFKQGVFKDFVERVPYCYAGFSTSNAMAEMISIEFDNELKKMFFEFGIVYYKRYIDDGLLILNQYISKDDCEKIIKMTIQKVYMKSKEARFKCKTELNDSKFNYISFKDMQNNISKTFNFLGYEYCVSNNNGKLDIQYGITEKKRLKYQKQLNKIVEEFKVSSDLELLKHRLKAYCLRIVYRTKRYKNKIWRVKGFVANYNELRHYKNSIIDTTESFLKNAVKDAFANNDLVEPSFIKISPDESPYQLFNCLMKNKSFVLVEHIGHEKSTLIKLCRQININIESDASYDRFVREYLIKVKVGH